MNPIVNRIVFIYLCVAMLVTVASGQTTSITYQGSLSVGGVPANGNYDFHFGLYSVASDGTPILPQQGANDVAVVNGIFSVRLNFAQNQFPGADRYLEIRVRPVGVGNYTVLTPRQQLASSPYSIRSLNSGNAEMLGGLASNQYVLTSDPRLSDERNPLPNSANYVQNRTTLQPGTNFNISGNGTIGSSLTARENSFFEKGLSVGTTLDVSGSATIGSNLTIGSTASVGALSVGSSANVSGTINTAAHYRISGSQVLSRSRLDLFNTAAVPRGYSFEVLNAPSFLVLRNDLGTTIMTVAPDGKVGIGSNNPNEATLEIGGTLAVSNLGGSNGDHLCRDGNLIRACPAAAASTPGHPESSAAKIVTLESTIRAQQAEIERQRNEFAALKNFICSQNPAAEICGPKQR